MSGLSGMPWWTWIVVGLVLLAAETHYTRDFSLFCVGLSAILVGAMTALGLYNLWTQWLGFALLSGATLFWARDWLRQHFLKHVEERELGNVLGEVAVPVDDFPAFGFGKADCAARDGMPTMPVRSQSCEDGVVG